MGDVPLFCGGFFAFRTHRGARGAAQTGPPVGWVVVVVPAGGARGRGEGGAAGGVFGDGDPSGGAGGRDGPQRVGTVGEPGDQPDEPPAPAVGEGAGHVAAVDVGGHGRRERAGRPVDLHERV